MNDNPTSDDSNKEKIDEESIKPISEEEGLKSAESIFKTEGKKSENPGSDEDKEFLKYLKFRKKAKDLGLDESSFTIYQGGIHITDSNVENHGNFVGNDQTIDSSLNTGGFSGEVRNKSSDRNESLESIESVFDRCEDIKQRSFMIALAALNGCNYRIVLEASQRLQSILQPQAEVETEASSPNTGSTEKKRSQWLEEISAYRADSYEVTEYGKSRIKTVLFTEQEAPLSILSHIWHEYDTYAEATLQWVCELGDNPNAEVRLRAAAVAGQLAIYEFRPVREKILSLWAKSDKQTVQRLAALALTVVAYDENDEIAQQALNLLHHWSCLQNSPRLHWTAIAAYGGYIGLLFPQQALNNLKIIAQSGDGRLFSDIAQAVASLFEAGQQVDQLHLLVLKSLKEWVGQGQKASIYRLSLLIFWGLMRESWMIEDNVRQPTLLCLAKQSQDYEDLIIYLMRNALNLELTRDLIRPEILDWLKFVDKQQTLYKTLARILFTLASPGKERERICHYLSRWSIKSETASRIHTLIKSH
jgi:hypothetical protein